MERVEFTPSLFFLPTLCRTAFVPSLSFPSLSFRPSLFRPSLFRPSLFRPSLFLPSLPIIRVTPKIQIRRLPCRRKSLPG